MPAPQIRKLTVRQVDSWRAGVQIAMIRTRLHDHIEGKVNMSPTQLQACKVLLDKAIPSLVQQDITVSESNEPRSIEDMQLELMRLLAANPALLSMLQAGGASLSLGSPEPQPVGAMESAVVADAGERGDEYEGGEGLEDE